MQLRSGHLHQYQIKNTLTDNPYRLKDPQDPCQFDSLVFDSANLLPNTTFDGAIVLELSNLLTPGSLTKMLKRKFGKHPRF